MVELETVAVAVGSSLLTSVVTGGAAFKLLVAAAETRFISKSRLYDANERPLFLPREEFNGASRRHDEQISSLRHAIEQNAGQIVSHTDRLADLDSKFSLMEERNVLKLEGISKDCVQTADSLEKATKRLEELALRFERFDASFQQRKRRGAEE